MFFFTCPLIELYYLCLFLAHMDSLLRMLVLENMGKYGEPSVVDEAKKRLSAHVAGTVIIPPDLRGAVYNTAMRQNSEAAFEQLIKVSKTRMKSYEDDPRRKKLYEVAKTYVKKNK